MEKQTIINQTLSAASTVLDAIQNDQLPDTKTLSKWLESLLRYVLCDISEQISGQCLKNLFLEFCRADTKEQEIEALNNFIAEIHHVTDDMLDLDHDIEYQVPFDDLYDKEYRLF